MAASGSCSAAFACPVVKACNLSWILRAREDLDPGSYDDLLTRYRVAAEGARPSRAYQQRCQVCHGADGRGVNGYYVPRLDLLEAPYIRTSLPAYRSGERYSGIMQQVATLLSDEEIDELADAVGRMKIATESVSQREGAEEPSKALLAALRQLELFKSGSRGGSSCARLMHEVVPSLDKAQMQSVAAYYASLPAASDILGQRIE